MNVRDIKADIKSMEERGVSLGSQYELIQKYIGEAFDAGAKFQMAVIHKQLFPNCKEADEDLKKSCRP